MKTFETYQAAKIAMPKACIVKYKYGGNYRFTGMPTREGTTLCNGSEFAEPQDHCMTVKQFFENGHKFIEGDLMIGRGGLVIKVSNWLDYNSLLEDDDKRYVLSAKALEEANTIPTETPEGKEALDKKTYRYEKVEFDDKWKYFKLMQEEGDLYVNCVDLSFEGFYGDNINLANALHDESCIYRRIEVTERELFIETYAWAVQDDISNIEDIAGMLFDSGKFKLVNGKG